MEILKLYLRQLQLAVHTGKINIFSTYCSKHFLAVYRNQMKMVTTMTTDMTMMTVITTTMVVMMMKMVTTMTTWMTVKMNNEDKSILYKRYGFV